MDESERPRLLMDLVNDANNHEVLPVLDKFHEWKLAKGSVSISNIITMLHWNNSMSSLWYLCEGKCGPKLK